MDDTGSVERRLRHERDNAEQENDAMKRLLGRAASEIEQLAEADCERDAKDQALAAAKRFRRAAAT
jgi:hypothetical protein